MEAVRVAPRDADGSLSSYTAILELLRCRGIVRRRRTPRTPQAAAAREWPALGWQRGTPAHFAALPNACRNCPPTAPAL
eukprot:2792573-Prymnesium_polylepis.1